MPHNQTSHEESAKDYIFRKIEEQRRQQSLPIDYKTKGGGSTFRGGSGGGGGSGQLAPKPKYYDLEGNVLQDRLFEREIKKEPAEPTQQVNIPQSTLQKISSEFRGGSRATSQTFGMNKVDTKVYPPGTIYKYKKGTVGKEQIPFFETYTIGEDFSSRISTPEEKKQLEEYQQSKIYEEVALAPPKSTFKREFGEAFGSVKSFSKEEFGVSPKVEAKLQEQFDRYGRPGQLVGGFITYVLPSTRGDIILT